MKSYGICPASCGEFVQGFVNKEEYLSSYAIRYILNSCCGRKIRKY